MSRPLFLFAHGAGVSSSSAWMQGWAARLAKVGTVRTFDYDYMRRGRRSPDRLPVLIETHRVALGAARKGHRGPLVLIGKSMGSRVGCHLALEEPVDAVVCLGYPLKGAGAHAALRDQVLFDVRVPVLFVQGTRDVLCPLDVLATVRARMTAPSELLVVEGGNHSLEVTKTALRTAGESQDDVDERVLAAITRFVNTR